MNCFDKLCPDRPSVKLETRSWAKIKLRDKKKITKKFMGEAVFWGPIFLGAIFQGTIFWGIFFQEPAEHVALQIIHISFSSNRDWKESLRQRNVSFTRLKFAEWRSAFKQPLTDVLQNRRSQKFCNIHRKHLCWSLIKLQPWRPTQHRCFSVAIAKFLRTDVFIEHL